MRITSNDQKGFSSSHCHNTYQIIYGLSFYIISWLVNNRCRLLNGGNFDCGVLALTHQISRVYVMHGSIKF